MFGNLFKKRQEYVDEEGTKPKKSKYLTMLIIAIAVLVLAFGGGKDSKEKTENPNNANEERLNFDFETYSQSEGERLESILEEIRGVGDVDVMLTLDSINEKVLAKNNKHQSASDIDGEKKNNKVDSEENIMLYGSGNTEKPYIIMEKLPKPSGVVVAAEGGGDETVKLEIYESVKALYGIGGNRIKVVCKKNNKKGEKK